MKPRLMVAAEAAVSTTLASGTAAAADGSALPDGDAPLRDRPMKTHAASVLASITLAAATLAVAAPAKAVPAPDTERLYITSLGSPQNPNANLALAALVGVERCAADSNPFDGYCDETAFPRAGTQVHTVISSCGNVIREETVNLTGEHAGFVLWFSPDGEGDLGPNSVNERVGTSWEYVLTITVPGYDPYALDGSYSGYQVKRPSCEEINSPGYGTNESTAFTVTKWSIKKGATTAKVGKTLKVTPTRTTGAKVSYAWKVGSKVVDRDRLMTVKKTYRGKKITVRVTVSKAGAQSVSKTLRYGKAR